MFLAFPNRNFFVFKFIDFNLILVLIVAFFVGGLVGWWRGWAWAWGAFASWAHSPSGVPDPPPPPSQPPPPTPFTGAKRVIGGWAGGWVVCVGGGKGVGEKRGRGRFGTSSIYCAACFPCSSPPPFREQMYQNIDTICLRCFVPIRCATRPSHFSPHSPKVNAKTKSPRFVYVALCRFVDGWQQQKRSNRNRLFF